MGHAHTRSMASRSRRCEPSETFGRSWNRRLRRRVTPNLHFVDRDWRQWAVGGSCSDSGDRVDEREWRTLTEDGVAAIEVRSAGIGNEELSAVRVLSPVRHAEQARAIVLRAR